MEYVLPDIEVKKAFQNLENTDGISDFVVRGFNLYGVSRFFLEMQFRINYAKSKEELTTKPSPVQTYHKTGTGSALLQRIKNKLNNYKNNLAKSSYYRQFDNLEKLNESVDLLFVATSGYKDKSGYSIELQEFVAHAHANKLKVAFVLPEYDVTINRRREYDYFYGLKIEKTINFTEGETDVINAFKTFLLKNLNFINEVDVTRITYQTALAISSSQKLEQIIKKAKPRLVVGRSLYSDKWVMMACKSAGIPALEVQHGVFTENNFYYHSLSKLNPAELLLPDCLGCLGMEWLDILRKQSKMWNENNSGLVGSSFFIKRANKKDKKLTVVVAFQDIHISLLDIRKDIQEFLEIYGKKMEGYQFILRIHPINSTSEFEFPMDADNISMSDPHSETTLQVLEKADVLIGATSMMLYEALSFNIPVFSFERYRKMTEEKSICFVASSKELFENLKGDVLKPKQELHYIDPLNYTFFEKLVLKINKSLTVPV